MSDTVAQPAPPLPAEAATDPFESLYHNAFPRVYAYVASLLRDRAAAEDVTAQAFERAYRRRRGFRASRGSREAWLFGIARNADHSFSKRGPLPPSMGAGARRV